MIFRPLIWVKMSQFWQKVSAGNKNKLMLITKSLFEKGINNFIFR